jgi:hypothetical protein
MAHWILKFHRCVHVIAGRSILSPSKESGTLDEYVNRSGLRRTVSLSWTNPSTISRTKAGTF